MDKTAIANVQNNLATYLTLQGDLAGATDLFSPCDPAPYPAPCGLFALTRASGGSRAHATDRAAQTIALP